LKTYNVRNATITKEICQHEEALREAQSYTAEVQDILDVLAIIDIGFASSKPVGKPKQLDWLMDGYNYLQSNRSMVERLLVQGTKYIERQNKMSFSIERTLQKLKLQWDTVVARYDATI
jgi:dystonin